MILSVYLRDKRCHKIHSNSFLIFRKVRIGYTQNKAEKIVEADNNQIHIFQMFSSCVAWHESAEKNYNKGMEGTLPPKQCMM